jgi:hypothetical protein
MPRLARGGKWVYGWIIVGGDRYIRLPREAWKDYGFAPGCPAIFLHGSRTSGGFALGLPDRVAGLLATRMLGRSVFEEGRRVRVPEAVEVKPWQLLLAVRGSARALGLVTEGPLYDAAAAFPGLPGCLSHELS